MKHRRAAYAELISPEPGGNGRESRCCLQVRLGDPLPFGDEFHLVFRHAAGPGLEDLSDRGESFGCGGIAGVASQPDRIAGLVGGALAFVVPACGAERGVEAQAAAVSVVLQVAQEVS